MTRKRLIIGIIILMAAVLVMNEVVAYWPTNHSVGELTKGEGFRSSVSAQNPRTPTEPASGPITISGYVYDRTAGDKIPHATISITLITNGGVGGSIDHVRKIISNENGFYSVTLDQLHNDPGQVNRFPYLGNEFVKLMLINDNNEMTITTTDKDGNFESTLFSTGNYRLKAIPYYGRYFESSSIEKDIYIDLGENYETIDPLIAMP